MLTLKSRIGAVLIPMLPINRRTFDVLRHELRSVRTRVTNFINPAYRIKVHGLRKRSDLSINLGSGGKGRDGWVNVELIPATDTTLCLDIRRPLPFSDASAGRVFAEHVVEHVDFEGDVPVLFSEVYRVLKPGGTFRVVVPDAQKHIEAYVSGSAMEWQALGWDVDALPDDIYTPMHIINHIFHQGGEHQFAYDFDTMKFVMKKVGFSTIRKMSYQASCDPLLSIDQSNHAPYSLYVEAIK